MQARSAEGSAPARLAAAAVLLADGEGGRGSAEPPVLTRVAGRSLLEVCTQTVERCDEIEGFVAVVPDGMEDRIAGVARESSKFLAAVPGGRSRRESVTAGLAAVPTRFAVVVCHDVARPLASAELFARVVRALDDADVVVPQVPVGDTVKRVERGFVRETIPREGLGVVQTPQGFRRHALATVGGGTERTETSMQDLSFLAGAGLRVATVPGEPANIEVRTMEDLRLVERLLAATHPG